jgi:hypothetical protein
MNGVKAELHRLKWPLRPAGPVQLALFDATGDLTAVLVQGRWLRAEAAQQAFGRAGGEQVPYKVLIGVRP